MGSVSRAEQEGGWRSFTATTRAIKCCLMPSLAVSDHPMADKQPFIRLRLCPSFHFLAPDVKSALEIKGRKEMNGAAWGEFIAH